MKIKLNNNYCISDDGTGFKLYQSLGTKVDKRTGKEYDDEKLISYPSTLESALKRYAREVNLDYEGDLDGYFQVFNKTLEDARKLS